MSEAPVRSPFRTSTPRPIAGRGWTGAAAVAAAAILLWAPPVEAIAPDGGTPSDAAALPMTPAPTPAAADGDIRSRLDGAGALAIAGEPVHTALLRRFYAAHGYEMIWTTRQTQATALWRAVTHAGDHGLDPDSFHAAAVAKSLSASDRDLLLSDAFLAYADALARGAVPDGTRVDVEDLSPGPVDTIAALDAAIASPNAEAAINALAPSTPRYTALQRAYQTYLAAAKSGGWPRVSEGPSPDRYRLLQQRLAVEGFLPTGYATNQFDELTLRAVKRFQERHGLEPADGKLGSATVAELNIPADARVRQLAVNLERQRWLARDIPPDRVWVNTANAELQLFRGNKAVFTTRAVVGEIDKQTPEFQAQIVSVLYNPPWNVPYSITQKEILPKLESEPDYLEKHHMTMRGNGSIQQEAGPYSALGRLKFEMPNRFDVYLHDTPLRHLFARDNRRMSHGCVRVQNPRQLASLLLEIAEDDITKGINIGTTNRHNLPQPLAVFVVYQTAFADDAGAVQFRRDVYQRDNNIAQRLSRAAQLPLAERGALTQRGG
jgi:murein L,D-transpeptidase YcbB/YkuD